MQENSLINQPTGMLTSMGGFITQVYLWMTGGLLITAAIAFIISSNAGLLYWIVTNSWVLPVVFLGEIALVLAISGLAEKLNPLIAAGLFLIYSALNGIFFGMIVSAYTESSVFVAFLAAAGTFMLMSGYGMVTKADLTRWGNLAIMGLIGLIVATVVNFFISSDGLMWVLTYLGVGIFIVLIAYDTQKLKHYAETAERNGNVSGVAILGALELYLDFINLFIYLLRIFGRRD